MHRGNLIRSIFYTLTILIISFSIFSIISAQETPPNEGNWTIKNNITVEGKEIVLKGDLIIQKGGELNLFNVDLKFNCEEDRQFKLKVENGGELNIYNSKISSNTNHLYVINVDTDGEFNIYNSTVVNYTTYDTFAVEEEMLFIILISIFIILIIVILLIYIFYHISKKKQKIMTTTIESLIGKKGQVVRTVKPNNYSGSVRVESQIWSATSNNSIPVNKKVKVVDIKGINLIVEKSND